MSQREFVRWQQFWHAEPWGSWRDNIHAAIIARASLLPYVKKGKAIELDEFMVMHPDERNSRARRKANSELIGMLRSMAGAPTKRKRKAMKPKG